MLETYILNTAVIIYENKAHEVSTETNLHSEVQYCFILTFFFFGVFANKLAQNRDFAF